MIPLIEVLSAEAAKTEEAARIVENPISMAFDNALWLQFPSLINEFPNYRNTSISNLNNATADDLDTDKDIRRIAGAVEDYQRFYRVRAGFM